MSDYLGRVIARSLGTTESIGGVIRPRVPSLFEPADTVTQQLPVESLFERRRPTLASNHLPTFDGAERRPASIDRPAPSSIIPGHREISPSEDKAAGEPACVYRGNLSHPVQSNVPIPRQRNTISEPVRDADRPRDPKASTPTMPDDVQGLRRTPSIESIRPNREAPSSFDAPQRGRTEAPVVRVTIGRIDVRAIMPAGETRRLVKPAAPKLSLDDYLARRETRRT